MRDRRALKRLRRLEALIPERAETLSDLFPGLPEGGEATVAAAFLNAVIAVSVRTNDKPTTLNAGLVVARRTAANLIAGIEPAFQILPEKITTYADVAAVNPLLRELGWDPAKPRKPGSDSWQPCRPPRIVIPDYDDRYPRGHFDRAVSHPQSSDE